MSFITWSLFIERFYRTRATAIQPHYAPNHPTVSPCDNKCTRYHSSSTTTSPSPPEPLRTRRPLLIPRFIVRFTPPSWRLRLSTKRRWRIPTEFRSRRSSNRRRRTAREPIIRVCRRRRGGREVFAWCWRIIRSRVLGSRI